MAQDPDKPRDDGRVKPPKTDAGMNKLAPVEKKGGKGSKAPDEQPVQKDRSTEVLSRMRKRFERCVEAERQNRVDALEDRKFKAGEQWPASIASQRQADGRPMLRINKIPTFIHQITNEQRQNRPQINISPVGSKADREAAKIFRGWIRAIERDSAADIAYDTAFDDAVTSGWGYWRILSEYEDDDGFEQTLRIRRVRNPFSVYLDPDVQEPEGADARFAFVTELMPRSEFEETYPNATRMPWAQAGVGEEAKNWITQHHVRVAEYYEIELTERTLVALDNGHVGFEDALDESVKTKIASGALRVLKKRTSRVPKCTWFKATFAEILEEREWPGRYIPIVRCIGEELDVEGKVTLSGLVRHAKDPQRQYNYWSTAETEMIALQPKAPFIVEEGQIEGHESSWKQANKKNFPYLLYRGVAISGKPAPPPQRQPFQGSPQGVVAAKMGAAQDMMATTGIRFDSTLNERLHDESGRAIREVRRSSDLGSFHYVDNLARALKHTGQILIDLAPHYLDTPRTLTILAPDDSEQVIRIDPNADKAFGEKPGNDGKPVKVFNPKHGKYGVTVTIGPSFATKRIEAAESMMAFAKAMPNAAQLIADLIAKHQDWPGAEEIATRLAKAVPAQYLTPEQKDMPPQAQALLAALDQQVKQLSTERQQLVAALNERASDRAVAVDKINKDFEAKLLAILQKSEQAMQSRIGDRVQELVDAVSQISDRLSAPAAVNAGATGVTGPNGPPAAQGGAPRDSGPQASA